MKFNSGDFIRCVDASSSGGELVQGKVYEAGADDCQASLVNVVGVGAWFQHRFKLAYPLRHEAPVEFVSTPTTNGSDAVTTVLGTQVGGSHYTDCAIQPIEYIWANKLGFSEGNIVKYVTRWKTKGGVKDLKKAHHHIALLIERTEADEARTGVKFGL